MYDRLSFFIVFKNTDTHYKQAEKSIIFNRSNQEPLKMCWKGGLQTQSFRFVLFKVEVIN